MKKKIVSAFIECEVYTDFGGKKNILKYTISFEIGIDNRCHILSEKLEQKKGNYTKNSYNLVFETADGVLLQLGNDEMFHEIKEKSLNLLGMQTLAVSIFTMKDLKEKYRQNDEMYYISLLILFGLSLNVSIDEDPKKKIALIITIAVCIVSVSANVYQYRVIRNKDAQIVWNQTTEDQMFQGILGHIQEEILYLQTCEPDEKDFRIGVAFGYCREAVNAYITTSYGASWKEHDLQQMVSEFEGYLENLQSDETQWKNAKNGDLDRLYDAWSEVLTQIDKGKKARVAAASKVRQILKNCATSPTS